MNYVTKEAQVTATGQAIKINALASNALNQLFCTNLGPNGTLKMLITPGNQFSLTNDGSTLCNEVTFTHPFSQLIASSAVQLGSQGDGVSSFVCLVCELFNNGFRLISDGIKPRVLCDGVKVAITDVLKKCAELKKPLKEGDLQKLVFANISTKIDSAFADKFSRFIVQAIESVKISDYQDPLSQLNRCDTKQLCNGSIDNQNTNHPSNVELKHSNVRELNRATNPQALNFGSGVDPIDMVEIMDFGEGDPAESTFIDGLVLDHGNRHPMMPTNLTNCRLLIANISLEYEKPEINVQFHYSTAEQRDSLVASERVFIFERAKQIADFATELRKTTGENLIIINEKGIDPISLELFANANVLALRRAKRCNLERLIKCCGGAVFTRMEQLQVSNLGKCGKVSVHSLGDDKYTFIEQTPYKGTCTILIKGNTSFEIKRIRSAIQMGLKSGWKARESGYFISGGIELYANLAGYLQKRSDEVDESLICGYKSLRKTFINLGKNLIRNDGRDVQSRICKLERNKTQEEKIYDSYEVISQVIEQGGILGINLLMVDDIIKAGKPLKEEEKEPQK